MDKDNITEQHTGNSEIRPVLWPFFLELAPLFLIPIVAWWGTTPTSVLNASPSGKLLETLGIWSLAFLYVGEIPVASCGILASRKMTRFRMTTKVLSIVHLIIGGFMLGMTILMLCLVVFGKVYH